MSSSSLPPTHASPKSPSAVNFSRPRPRAAPPSTPTAEDRSNTSTRAIDAFHEPNRRRHEPWPDEPRFSIDSQSTGGDTSENSNTSDFAWDGRRGELIATPRPSTSVRDQRHPGLGARQQSSSTSSSAAAATALPSPGSSHRTREPPKGILKPPPAEPREDDAGSASVSSAGIGEDGASHHTVSEDGSFHSYDADGNFIASDYDISGLSEKKIAKLRKKGINPALYAEMKQARKGKGLVSTLTGNSYVS